MRAAAAAWCLQQFLKSACAGNGWVTPIFVKLNCRVEESALSIVPYEGRVAEANCFAIVGVEACQVEEKHQGSTAIGQILRECIWWLEACLSKRHLR